MANHWMPSGLTAFANGDVDWPAATIKVAAMDSTYVQDDGHTVVNQLTGVLATLTLAGKAVLDSGVLDANDGTFTGVANGDTITQLMAYVDTGDPATSTLLFYMDTNEDGTPISRTSDGSAIPLVWSATADRIARL